MQKKKIKKEKLKNRKGILACKCGKEAKGLALKITIKSGKACSDHNRRGSTQLLGLTCAIGTLPSAISPSQMLRKQV